MLDKEAGRAFDRVRHTLPFLMILRSESGITKERLGISPLSKRLDKGELKRGPVEVISVRDVVPFPSG
jgi:hypothetical protein